MSEFLNTIRRGQHFQVMRPGTFHPMSELYTNLASFAVAPFAFIALANNLGIGGILSAVAISLQVASIFIHWRSNQ